MTDVPYTCMPGTGDISHSSVSCILQSVNKVTTVGQTWKDVLHYFDQIHGQYMYLMKIH